MNGERIYLSQVNEQRNSGTTLELTLTGKGFRKIKDVSIKRRLNGIVFESLQEIENATSLNGVAFLFPNSESIPPDFFKKFGQNVRRCRENFFVVLIPEHVIISEKDDPNIKSLYFRGNRIPGKFLEITYAHYEYITTWWQSVKVAKEISRFLEESTWRDHSVSRWRVSSNSASMERFHGTNNICDVAAGTGGDTICFSQYFDRVFAFEPDKVVFRVLKNNLDCYRNRNVFLYNTNFGMPTEAREAYNLLLQHEPSVIYIDAPWSTGSSSVKASYKDIDYLDIKLDSHDVFDIADYLLGHFNFIRLVVLKVPVAKMYRLGFSSKVANVLSIRKVSWIFLEKK
jgi:RNA cap guanine-N2 methyltransferase